MITLMADATEYLPITNVGNPTMTGLGELPVTFTPGLPLRTTRPY
jgi:hypothetical protein